MSNKVVEIVKEIKGKNANIHRVLFVGCGASMADLYPAYYFITHESNRFLTTITTANEFNYDTPKVNFEDTIVITASLGGSTPETVAATRKARELGAHVISLSYSAGSAILKEAEYEIVHDFGTNYAAKTEKMTYALALAIEIVAQFEGYPHYEEAQQALNGIGNLIEKSVLSVGPAADKFAESYKNDKTIYVVGSGATANVAYSTAAFLFMEMQWISSPNMNSGEYFHGPFELTEKNAPYLLFMSDGKTRSMDMRALTFMQRFDAKVTVIDAKDYGLASVAGPNVIDYFNPMLITGVMRVYAEKLAEARKHPLTKRRYMWKLEY